MFLANLSRQTSLKKNLNICHEASKRKNQRKNIPSEYTPGFLYFVHSTWGQQIAS